MSDTKRSEDVPVDLSAIDPARDELRWQRMIASVTARAVARRRAPIAREVVRRALPAMALAAAAALAVWLAAPARPRDARAVTDATEVLTGWALGGAIAPDDVLGLGGDRAGS